MKLVKHLFIVLAICCTFSLAALAQTDTGSLSGTISDPNGAIVPGATITATHVPTGRSWTLTTSQAGLYVFPELPTGPYTLTVKQTGFKFYEQTGIEVRVGLRENIDIQLTLGAVQQTVEVKSTAPVLETTSAVRGVGLSPQTLQNLPLWNGTLELANSFVGYMPGVTSNGETSINGSIGRGSELMIDGTSIVVPESGGTNFEFPGFYAFSEMKIVTSGYTAENGRVGGGIQEYVTRSGTNQFHGAAFYNFKRQFLDAVPWSVNQNPAARDIAPCRAPQAVACRPKERYNEEGGYAGGPIYIPHVYDGRNRTFGFFTWTGFWQPASIAVNGSESTPTAQMLQGNFSNVLNSNGLPIPIYDPATTTNGVRTQFSGNIIPTTRFSTIAKNVIPYIPAPDAGAPGIYNGNYTFNSLTNNLNHVWSFKIDHSIHEKNRISFFMTHRQDFSNTTTYYPGPLSDGLNSLQLPFHENASDDYIINPHMVLHTVWGFHQDRQQWNSPLQGGFASKFGFPITNPNSNATPRIQFETDMTMPNDGSNGGYLTWGMDQGKTVGGQWNWTTQVAQTLTWIRGKHEFKMGWDIRRMRTISTDYAGSNGDYFFSSNQTRSTSASSGNGTGFSFASFLLGDVDNANQGALPVFTAQTRYGYHAGFWQDTWRVRPKLTLTYGIRYEVPVGWHGAQGNTSSFSPTAPDPGAGNLPGAIIFEGDGPGRVGTTRTYPMDFSDIGPRFGLAWNVRPSVVIRGGWGIFYEALGNGGCGCTDGFSGGTFSQSSDGFNPAFQWDPGGANPNAPVNNPGGVQPPSSFKGATISPSIDNFVSGGGSMYYWGPHYGKAPRVYDYNFTIQKEFKNWLFELAYVGDRSVGLASSIYMNTLPTSDLFLGTAGPVISGTPQNFLQTGILPTSANYQNVCLAAAANAISCTNGVPNLPFSTFGTWGGGATLAQAIRPFPQYGTVYSANSGDGRNWYDSAQFKVERRFGNLNFESSYVFSKMLDILAYRQIFTQTTQQGAQDSYNLKADKSEQIEDMPNVINVVSSYRLPFGRGQKFMGHSGGLMDHLVNGWIASMVGQYRSGALIQVLNPTNNLGNELFSTLTKATNTGLPPKTNVSTNSLDPNNTSIRWFNSGANAPFKATPAFTLGNYSYYNNLVRQPWYRYEAISVNKEIKIWESVSINYQLNILNPFNRTAFGGINTTIGSAGFGVPGSAQDGPRDITMGLRLEF